MKIFWRYIYYYRNVFIALLLRPPFLASCKHIHLIGNMKVLSQGSAEMTSEKKERNATFKKKTMRMKSLQYIIDLFIDLLGFRGVISDVLDVF